VISLTGQEKNLIIKALNGNQIFTYHGTIIDDSDDFLLTFNDAKEGRIKLNKRFIISIKGDKE